ncbi:MAG: hypothetical protein KC877_00320, partial [Candidatus Kaiserbacteria bacterium]|nr:hypothetical protein [Candidatus Kaiserbacteria bacterium]
HATSVAAQDTVPRDLAFNTTGTRMYVIGSSNNKVYEYDLSSAFDISTAAFVSSKDISTEDLFGYGLAFNTTGTKMYMTGSVNDSIYEYVITEEEQTFSGTMTGGSAFNDLVTAGTLPLTFSDNASTTDFTIGSGTATVTAPTLLTVAGDLTNSGGGF